METGSLFARHLRGGRILRPAPGAVPLNTVTQLHSIEEFNAETAPFSCRYSRMRIGKTAHALMNNVKLHDERKRLRLRKSPAGNQSPLHDAGVHLHRRPERVALVVVVGQFRGCLLVRESHRHQFGTQHRQIGQRNSPTTTTSG